MTEEKLAILLIDDDDEFTKYIRNEIQHQFPSCSVTVCHTAMRAKQQLIAWDKKLCAVIFDSGFGKNKLAGCELFRELCEVHPWLAGRAVFHTAYDEEVHVELVSTGFLPEHRLIGKSIDSLQNLNQTLQKILAEQQ